MTRNILWCLLIIGFISVGVSAQPELDTTFNGTGIQTVSFGINASGAKVAIQPDNKIVMAGSCTPSSSQQCVARYNEDGSLDTTFGQQGFVVNFDISSSSAVALQSDGKIVVSGSKRVNGSFPVFSIHVALSRYTADGVLDSSFGGGNVTFTAGMGLASPRAMVIQPDGKIVIVGESSQWSTFPNSSSGGWIARYLPNGTPDTSFDGDGVRNVPSDGGFPITQTGCTSVALQPDGKLLLGVFTGIQTPGYKLMRWNPDGTPDPTWGGGDGIVNLLSSMSNLRVMPDGRIVGINSNSIYRFNPDGSLDTSLDGDGSRPLTGLTSTPYDLAVSASGKLTLVGRQPNGSEKISIYKLKADGSVETGFGNNGLLTISNPFDAANGAYSTSCAFDSQGRLVVGGTVTASPSRFTVIRLVAPPVMSVSVSGRVTDASGNGVSGVTVSTQGASATTNPFGFYTLNNVQTNRTYVFSVRSKTDLSFNKRTILVDDQLAGIDFVGEQLDPARSKIAGSVQKPSR